MIGYAADGKVEVHVDGGRVTRVHSDEQWRLQAPAYEVTEALAAALNDALARERMQLTRMIDAVDAGPTDTSALREAVMELEAL